MMHMKHIGKNYKQHSLLYRAFLLISTNKQNTAQCVAICCQLRIPDCRNANSCIDTKQLPYFVYMKSTEKTEHCCGTKCDVMLP